MEFEWKIFPGFTTVETLNQIQQMMGELPGWQKLHAQTVAWSYDMFKKVTQLYKVSHPCLDDHQFKKGGIGISCRIVSGFSLLS